MADLRILTVQVNAQVDDGETLAEASQTQIPPDYDAMDIRALVVRKVEDTAFALVRRDFGRQPTLDALRAYVARLIAVERAVDDLEVEDVAALRTRIRAIIALSNVDAIELYGEATDHEA